MIFNTPLIPFQAELYSMLTNADEMTVPVFDSGLSLDEILPQLKGMSEVEFGTVADISCTPSSAKFDTITYVMNVRIELFSTYKGRKKVAELINLIGSVATKYRNVFDARLRSTGFAVIEMAVGESTIGSAMTAGGLTWQNGYINLMYRLGQISG